jgi:type I restriction enzyme S subunit
MNHKNCSPQLRFESLMGNGKEFRLVLCSNFKKWNSITSSDIFEDGASSCFYGGNGLRGRTNSYTHEGVFTLKCKIKGYCVASKHQ